ncbi:TPA: hypothetical protein RH289_000240, partial [Escherichia coli]|nr:hypothetical protein [Escherichia coli]HDV4024931.1 hypothetical protein [Escherichia coli]
MKLTPVIAALRARCPYFENRVAGAAQFKNLPEVGNSHVGGFMYEPYQANNLYPLSVALMQAAGPTSTEWAQLAVSYGGAFRAFLGRQTYNGNPEISELYHDQRKPSASDVGAQPLNATLTTLSGKDAAGLRSVLGLGTTATRNV